MRREKRKEKVLENKDENQGKKSKIKQNEEAVVVEEPTDEEVEQFFVILRRMKEAAEYFGVGKRVFTESFRTVVGEKRDHGAKAADEILPEVEKKKGNEVVAENGLPLDLNIALVETDGGDRILKLVAMNGDGFRHGNETFKS